MPIDRTDLMLALLIELRALDTLQMRTAAQVVRRRRIERALWRLARGAEMRVRVKRRRNVAG